jgi:hypothetical protein
MNDTDEKLRTKQFSSSQFDCFEGFLFFQEIIRALILTQL